MDLKHLGRRNHGRQSSLEARGPEDLLPFVRRGLRLPHVENLPPSALQGSGKVHQLTRRELRTREACLLDDLVVLFFAAPRQLNDFGDGHMTHSLTYRLVVNRPSVPRG